MIISLPVLNPKASQDTLISQSHRLLARKKEIFQNLARFSTHKILIHSIRSATMMWEEILLHLVA